MNVAVAFDHRGVHLRGRVLEVLQADGHIHDATRPAGRAQRREAPQVQPARQRLAALARAVPGDELAATGDQLLEPLLLLGVLVRRGLLLILLRDDHTPADHDQRRGADDLGRERLQGSVLDRRGVAPESVLRLGDTYRALRAGLQPWPVSPREHRSPMDVNAGRGFVFISHVGAVHPSGFLPAVAGNVRTRPLGEIYRESALFKSLRDISELKGRCGRCEFAVVCGGSRSRAFAITNDALAEDPLCQYSPGDFFFHDDLREMLPVLGAGAIA